MSRLSDFARVALIGTQHEALPDPADDSAIESLLARMEGLDPAANLLSRAGTMSLYQQIGQLPQRLPQTNPPSAAPLDPRPYCSAAAAYRLGAMLGGHHQDLLTEFLTALTSAGTRVPAEHIPNLLDRGQKMFALRALIIPVIGDNGRWLAAQNPDWRYAAPDIDSWAGLSQQWRTEAILPRQNLLRQIRHLNPALGRQLLESRWKAEPTAARTSLIKGLETGLSPADEPFLETTLDDRDLTVRRKAADLLARLPESRLCRRMTTHTATLLQWHPDQKHRISLSFPAELTAQMLRDGVSIPKVKNLARARSIQIVDMVGAVPLNRWTNQWQATPDEVVQAALTSRWPRTLIRAFAIAAGRQKNEAWAGPLMAHDDYGVDTLKLVSILSADSFETLVIQLEQKGEALKDSTLLKVLRRWPHAWSARVGTVWLNQLIRAITSDPAPTSIDTNVRLSLRQFAKSCPPQMHQVVSDRLLPLTPIGSVWRLPLQDVIAIMKYRKAMLAELEVDTGSRTEPAGPHAERDNQ